MIEELEFELPEQPKTCPFCKTEPDVWPSSGRKWIHIQCPNKKCVQPHVDDYAPRALKKWNRRDG